MVIDTEKVVEQKLVAPHFLSVQNRIAWFLSHNKGITKTEFQDRISEILAFVECTEAGNALRLHARHRDLFHFVALWQKWYLWNGRTWVEDQKQVLMNWAKETAAYIEIEADHIPPPTDEDGNTLEYPDASISKDMDKETYQKREAERDRIKKLYDAREKQVETLKKWGKTSHSRRALEAMLELVKSEPGVTVLPEELNTFPTYLNCLNGVVNIRDDKNELEIAHTKVLPHDHQRLITKEIPVYYDPEARCPRWDAFLHTAMNGNDDMVSFIQEVMGLALSGEKIEDFLIVFYGSGGNGKTVFSETMRKILGPYSEAANAELLVEKKNEVVSNDVAKLVGCRLLLASETKDGAQLDEAKIKGLTGGDSQTVRFLFKEYFTFIPEFTPILLTNHKPVIKGTDEGIWRRVKLVPWLHNFEKSTDRKDKNVVLRELWEEREGILAWMIRGYQRRINRGKMSLPEEVIAATEQYRRESDLIGQFLEECFELDTAYALKTFHAEIYKQYEEYCKNNGNFPLASSKLSIRLAERGITGGTSNGRRYWNGIKGRNS